MDHYYMSYICPIPAGVVYGMNGRNVVEAGIDGSGLPNNIMSYTMGDFDRQICHTWAGHYLVVYTTIVIQIMSGPRPVFIVQLLFK